MSKIEEFLRNKYKNEKLKGSVFWAAKCYRFKIGI